MKKAYTTRNSMLGDKLMEKWGYKAPREEESLREGIVDRTIGNVKSFASGITDPISRARKALKGKGVHAAEETPVLRKQRVKFNSLLGAKLKKIRKIKEDLQNDMDIMGIDPGGNSAAAALGLLDITVEALGNILDGETELFEPMEKVAANLGTDKEGLDWGLAADLSDEDLESARKQFEMEFQKRSKTSAGEGIQDAEWSDMMQ